MDDLRFVSEFLRQRRPECKLVLFIDDLDRCSEQRIIEVLQAIHLVLGDSRFFVFLCMDTEMIYRAIRSYYAQASSHMPEGFENSYLRKIVQLSLHLPRMTSEKRFHYLSTLFSKKAQFGLASKGEGGIARFSKEEDKGKFYGLRYNPQSIQKPSPAFLEEVEDTADELMAFEEYRDLLEDNPRGIKRLVNTHRFTKIVLQLLQGNTSWSAERQRKLIEWLIFCAKWPALVPLFLDYTERSGPSSNLLENFVSQ